MAVQSQFIDIPLGSGVSTDRVQELLDAPSLLSLWNADPSKLGGYTQRRLPVDVELDDVVGALVRRSASDVLAFTAANNSAVGVETSFTARSQTIGAAIMRYTDGVHRRTSAVVPDATVVIADVGSNASHVISTCYVPRGATYPAHHIISYSPTSGDGYAVVVDEYGTIIGRQTFTGSAGNRIELAASPVYGVAFFGTTNLYGQRFDPATATWDARVTIDTDGPEVAWPEYVEDIGFIVAADTDAKRIRVISEALAITETTAGVADAVPMAIYVEGDTISVVSSDQAGTYFEDLRYESFGIVSSTSVVASASTLFTWNVAEDLIPLRVAIAGGSSETEVLVFVDSANGLTTNDNGYARVNTLTGAWSDSHKCPDLRIAHRGYKDSVVGIVLSPDEVDSVVATIRIDDDNHVTILGYLNPGFATSEPHPLSDSLTCSAFVSADTGAFSYVIPKPGPSSALGIALVQMTPRAYRSAAGSGTAYIAGGTAYDGEAVFSPVQVQAPRVDSVTGSASGGFMSNGTYLVRFTWYWDDRNGNRHESAPSVAETVTLSGGGTSQSIDFDVKPTIYSERATSVRLGVYITDAGGTLFYQATTGGVAVPVVTLLETGAARISGTITNTGSAAPLYTDSGELDNYAPPPSDECVLHGNRLWCISREDGSLWPSKLIRDGFGVGWNPALAISNPRRNRPVALASLGDRLAVFYPDEIAIVYGDGPDNIGQGAPFSAITVAYSGVGAYSREVTPTSIGVVFQSRQALTVLDMGGGITALPQTEDSYRVPAMADALLVGVAESAVDTSILTAWNNGEIWAYNTRAQAWSKSTVTTPTDADLFDVPSRGAQWQSTAALSGGTYSVVSWSQTAGNFGSFGLMTPWIKLGGLQGFQRVRRAWLMMDVAAAASENPDPVFQVAVHYDYDTTAVETFSYTRDDVSGLDGFPHVSLPLRLGRQRCTSLALTFGTPTINPTDDPDGALAGPFRIVGIRLELAMLGKQRRNVMPATGGGGG